MYDPKEKALSGIEIMVEKRMGNRLKPKKKEVEIEIEPVEEMHSEGGEAPEEESLEAKVPEGADVSALSPEEQEQLKSLYSKMGC